MENTKHKLRELSNAKHVFWQAFFLTMLFFFLGLVLGVYLEQLRSDNANMIFYQSETSLYDSFALGKLLDNPAVSCENLRLADIDFANKIYKEAKQLEKFENSNELTNSLRIIHRKYDLLRTLLWMNTIKVKNNCGKLNTVVYLYKYDAQNIQISSKQNVWSMVLKDLKKKNGDNLVLIPIAVDQNITSLNYLIKTYHVKEFPAVILNEKTILYNPKNTDTLDKYLN